eukprot:664458-Rhodomonas_salina.4
MGLMRLSRNPQEQDPRSGRRGAAGFRPKSSAAVCCRTGAAAEVRGMSWWQGTRSYGCQVTSQTLIASMFLPIMAVLLSVH